jgi:hypothetical protein
MSNNKNKIASQFIVHINTREEDGSSRVREFITYAGLLAVAHDVGLEEMNTTVVQMPTDGNGQTAVIRAIAKGKPGLFTGLGDANPQNVNRKVAKHLLRVAETRAKARALRDFCNINVVALEELGDEDVEFVSPPRQQPVHVAQQHQQQPAQPMQQSRERGVTRIDDRRDGTISDAQKRALWRKALTLGYEGPRAHAFLLERLGVEPSRATRMQASRLLDVLSEEERRASQAGGHAAE